MVDPGAAVSPHHIVTKTVAEKKQPDTLQLHLQGSASAFSRLSFVMTHNKTFSTSRDSYNRARVPKRVLETVPVRSVTTPLWVRICDAHLLDAFEFMECRDMQILRKQTHACRLQKHLSNGGNTFQMVAFLLPTNKPNKGPTLLRPSVSKCQGPLLGKLRIRETLAHGPRAC